MQRFNIKGTVALSFGPNEEQLASRPFIVRAGYFKDVDGKLAAGGCFTAHNVLDGFAGVGAFLEYVRARPGYTTTISRTSRSGFSVSCKSR